MELTINYIVVRELSECMFVCVFSIEENKLQHLNEMKSGLNLFWHDL